MGVGWSRDVYLEHKQLLAEDGQGVEAPVADVGLGVGVGGLVPLGGAVGPHLPLVLPGVGGRVVQAGRGGGRRGSGGLRGAVGRT